MFPYPMPVNTVLTQGTTIVQGLFIEMFLTAELMFAILMLAAEKTKATFLAPVGIGLALFVAELAGQLSKLVNKHYSIADCLDRCLLHRRFTEPSEIVRPLRCQPELPWIPLDLLARARPWSRSCWWILQIRQILKI